MAVSRYNFQHMNILDGLVSLGIWNLVRMVMASMDYPVVVQYPLPESNGTIQMDCPFHLDYSYILDYD